MARLLWLMGRPRWGGRAAGGFRLAPLFVMCLAALSVNVFPLSQAPHVALTQQVKHLGPDARLYWGLAKNLEEGPGFFDTVRHREIIPSIGHPKLMSLGWSVCGYTPAQYTLTVLWLATLLVTWAVYRYTRSASLALASLAFQLAAAYKVRWLVGNVECSLVFANALLLVALAELYRAASWRPWGILAGLALGLVLLVRPVILYPVHFVAGASLLVLVVPRLRRRLQGPWWASTGLALMVAVFVAEAVLVAGRIDSQVKYGDSREVTGTYGAWPLYCANNPDVRIDAVYRDPKHSKHWREMSTLVSARYGPAKKKLGWEKRQQVLISEAMDYWTSQPGRALRGYVWRLQRLLGLHRDAWDNSTSRVHITMTVLLLGLLAANVWRRTTRVGLGVLSAAWMLSYSTIHALFVWVGIRYATPLFPLMAASIPMALSDWVRGRAS